MAGCDITVIIPTSDRSESLGQTLRHLAAANRDGLRVTAVVVQNGNEGGAREVADAWNGSLPVHYVHEPRRGKEFALNRGIEHHELGEIVAFLDDDMSPESGWWQGVQAITDRHPDCDFFTGRSYVVWPHDEIPGWAQSYAVQSWAHSVLDYGNREHVFEPGEWPSPNMFWIRRRVLDDGRQFDEGATARYHTGDIDFLLRLAEDGFKGVAGPDAVAGHRIQPELLHLDVLRRRAIRIGRSLALVRRDKPRTLPQARLRCRHPVVFALLSAANLVRWAASYLAAYLKPNPDARTVQQLVALLGMANNWEALRARRR